MYIIKRMISGHMYHYAVEKQRVNGKVKTVKQIYLGPVERIVACCRGENKSIEVTSRTFGSIALLLWVSQLYDLENIFNSCIGKKRKNDISGRYFLSIIINRVLEPKSKSGIDGWMKTTVLDWLWHISATSQKYWNHLDYLDDRAIAAIEQALTEKTFELTSDNDFLWDTSNYFTFIRNRKSDLLGKGKSKHGRHDKNLICHGLLVGRTSGIPVKHCPYKYAHDSRIFSRKLGEIATMLKGYRKDDFTLVLDKGNNSEKSIKALSKYRFIGSLRKEQVPDLLSIPSGEYASIYTTNKGHEVFAYDAGIKEFYSNKFRVVIAYERESYEKQKATFKETVMKTMKKYREAEPKRFKTSEAAANALAKILPPKYRKMFRRNVAEDDSMWKVVLSVIPENETLYETHFGKTVLFTNRLDDSAGDIVKSYRSLSVVESQFRALHNSFLIPVTPVFEWTDQKIKAHVFLCYVALVMVRTLELMAEKKGLQMTFPKLLEEAGKIRLGLLTDGAKAEYCFERTTPLQQKIMDMFSLREYAAF